MTFLFSLVFLIPVSGIGQTNSIPVIPQPNEVTVKKGEYVLNDGLVVFANVESLEQLTKDVASLLGDEFKVKGNLIATGKTRQV
ncbi:hypothetical protein SAMN04487911_13113 [Arenibacter nanhaiticus]|uniref:Uncharacterized protein n=1 Tax=Arenibacter nanhaiticus TaxID=558155 RepID=A0A1M6LEY2_9FLAO|nr:hypothetical protein [Arenibacter nanhaiticus]SHJ69722.1 hypothetical protein SAMN04487911_13113 [Arenibacter nanhaiticus]